MNVHLYATVSRVKYIEIRWTYPKSPDAAWESEESYGRGIYQITRLFGGNESLLYIGVVKGEDRNFYQRLSEHWSWLQSIRGTVRIRFGKIVGRQGFTLTREILETAEGALIWEHQPSENTAKMNDYRKYHHLVITNSGYRGFLNQVVDTRFH